MFAKLARRLGQRQAVITFARLVIVPIDRVLARLTGGRVVLFGMRDLTGLMLTTTGRRSGEPRTVPLLYLADGDDYLVVGSNFGRHAHPAWSTNLLANPDATVTVRGTTIPVRAQLAEGAEREALMVKLKRHWPAYGSYEVWADGRTLRVFRLTRR